QSRRDRLSLAIDLDERVEQGLLVQHGWRRAFGQLHQQGKRRPNWRAVPGQYLDALWLRAGALEQLAYHGEDWRGVRVESQAQLHGGHAKIRRHLVLHRLVQRGQGDVPVQRNGAQGGERGEADIEVLLLQAVEQERDGRFRLRSQFSETED